jgi:mannitol-1-/sugar-/sorbitol-6-/2-deoxyglucose-6-phosphatase
VIFTQDSGLAYRNVFKKNRINLTEERMKQSTGLRVDEEVVEIFKRFNLKYPSPQIIIDNIKNEVIRLIVENGEIMNGVQEVIELFEKKSLILALASSSDYNIIQTVLDKFKLNNRFHVIHSAEDEPYGKPHPGVYLTAAKKLDVTPKRCLAIEDSFYGVLSAKAALMRCIAVPEEYPNYDKRFILADYILPSLISIDSDFIDRILIE